MIGVLIALTAEGIVERWHWQNRVEDSNFAFKNELLVSARNAYERLVVQRCLQGRLRALGEALNSSGGTWHAMPETFHDPVRFYSNVMPIVYRPPIRPVHTDTWRTALVDGTINHLDPARAAQLSIAYNTADNFGRL